MSTKLHEHAPEARAREANDSLYREDKFILVLDPKTGKEARITFEGLTLSHFREKVALQLFGIKQLKELPNEIPRSIKLIWCGRELKEGISWHTGLVEEDDLMTELDPGVNADGQPMMQALGGESLLME